MQKIYFLKYVIALYMLLSLNTINATIIDHPDRMNSSAHLVDFENLDAGNPDPIWASVIDEDYNSVSIRAYEFADIGPQLTTGRVVGPYYLPGDENIFGGNAYGFAEDKLSIYLVSPNNSGLRVPYDNSMSEVGFGILNNRSLDTYIEVFGEKGQLLETARSGVDFPVVESGGHNPIFVGFKHSNNDISRIIIHVGQQAYNNGGNGGIAIDNIFYHRKADLVEMSETNDSYDSSTGALHMPVVQVGTHVFEVDMVHQGNLMFKLISVINSSKKSSTPDTYNPAIGIVHMPRVIVDSEHFKVDMRHLGDLLFKLTSAVSIAAPE